MKIGPQVSPGMSNIMSSAKDTATSSQGSSKSPKKRFIATTTLLKIAAELIFQTHSTEELRASVGALDDDSLIFCGIEFQTVGAENLKAFRPTALNLKSQSQ